MMHASHQSFQLVTAIATARASRPAAGAAVAAAVADLRAPERLRSGRDHGFDRDVHGAHLLAGSRSNHQPLPSEAVALGDRTP